MGGATHCVPETVVGDEAVAAWYVVQTKRRREDLAAATLGRVGLAAYSPRIKEWPPPAVGSAIGPMFPGYIFVEARLPGDHYSIIRSMGVKGLLHVGDSPAAIDASVVAYLREREDSNGVVHPVELGNGTHVEIARGPLRGMNAIVQQRLPARDRVRLLLELFEREVEIEVPEQWLRRSSTSLGGF